MELIDFLNRMKEFYRGYDYVSIVYIMLNGNDKKIYNRFNILRDSEYIIKLQDKKNFEIKYKLECVRRDSIMIALMDGTQYKLIIDIKPKSEFMSIYTYMPKYKLLMHGKIEDNTKYNKITSILLSDIFGWGW